MADFVCFSYARQTTFRVGMVILFGQLSEHLRSLQIMAEMIQPTYIGKFLKIFACMVHLFCMLQGQYSQRYDVRVRFTARKNIFYETKKIKILICRNFPCKLAISLQFYSSSEIYLNIISTVSFIYYAILLYYLKNCKKTGKIQRS